MPLLDEKSARERAAEMRDIRNACVRTAQESIVLDALALLRVQAETLCMANIMTRFGVEQAADNADAAIKRLEAENGIY